MPRTRAAPNTTAVDLARCLTPQPGQNSITVMMRTLVEGFAADGCVLWETYRGLSSRPKNGPDRLLVMASWFKNQSRVLAVHDLLVDEYPTGAAILSGEPQMHPDLREVQRRPISLNSDFDLRAMLAVPITFADGVHGAVTLYRCGKCEPFNDQDCNQLVDLAPIVPQLYKAIRNAESLELLNQVSERLSTLAALRVDLTEIIPSQFRIVFNEVCALIARAFHALEVSLYLRNRCIDPQKYYVAGTTWTFPTLHPFYEPAPQGRGLTSWVLQHGKPGLIFNWLTWEQDKVFYRTEYPGLDWNDHLGLIPEALRVLKNDSPDLLPPLSAVSTPLFLGGDLVGVLRCSAGRLDPNAAGPWYYNQSDLRLLEMVAGGIARSWGFYVNHYALIQERNLSESRNFTDLRHQLHTPLNQLQIRSEQFLRSFSLDTAQERRLLIVRGLARKASSVATSIGFLATPEDAPLRSNLTPISREELHKLLFELAQDNQAMSGSGIRFSLDHGSLNETSLAGIKTDFVLLHQAVSNLLDNAGKYSYPNTTVGIQCGNTGKGNLHITVSNKGIPMRAAEVQKIGTRGYRTEEALASVGEGSGIGLWIVRRIMKAHRGFLEILPTNKEGITLAKLIFPRTEN